MEPMRATPLLSSAIAAVSGAATSTATQAANIIFTMENILEDCTRLEGSGTGG